MRSAQLLPLVAGTLISAALAGDPPIKTLLITGQNNHNWRFTSRLHRDTLEATGRFAVDITDTPASVLADAKALGAYQLLVLDYNANQRWPAAAEANFLAAVQNGAGVVAIHATNNAFPGWAEYERMLGLLWREGTGHGAFHPFDVVWTDREHPITKGLPDLVAHPDELYHRLVNCQKAEFHLLGQALSKKETGGTGNQEPMALTLSFGKGRVFATPLGHVWDRGESGKASITDPQFKTLLCRGAEWAATGAVTLSAAWRDVRAHNVLSEAEHKDGWKLLFDGKTTAGFRGYKQDKVPASWVAQDGELRRIAGGAGPDLMTAEAFGDFELALEFKVAKGGNSGVIYRCTEDHDASYETGPELQILDDLAHDKSAPKNKCGSLYDLLPMAVDVARPAGEWNSARIVARGPHLEHWLNGFKVLECDLDSADYAKLRAASKWATVTDFGMRKAGHVALQDHGSEVAFRNVKVRVLPAR